eukprot:3568061-Amphidinium_carterae.3
MQHTFLAARLAMASADPLAELRLEPSQQCVFMAGIVGFIELAPKQRGALHMMSPVSFVVPLSRVYFHLCCRGANTGKLRTALAPTICSSAQPSVRTAGQG